MLTKRPKSIKDCYKLDKTSEQLIEWSHTLSDRAYLIFYILIGLGIILFIAAGIVVSCIDGGEIISISLLSGGICCVIAAFIARAVLRSNALLIYAKANIVHNTRVTANLALYNACKNSDPSEYNEDTDKKSTNQPKKDNKTAYNVNAIIESEENDDEDDDEDTSELPQKICPKCGNKHDFDYPKCPKCKYEYYKSNK